MRFVTDIGSFASSGTPVRQTPAVTGSDGSATVQLFAVEGESGQAHVWATDDSTTPAPVDMGATVPDLYDWEALTGPDGQPLSIQTDPLVLTITPGSITTSVCDNQVAMSATLLTCGEPAAGQQVNFRCTNGTFLESGQQSAVATTGSDGVATVTLLRPQAGKAAEDTVEADATVDGIPVLTNPASVTWPSWVLTVKASPDWITAGDSASVRVKLTLGDGSTPVTGQSVALTTNHGTFANHQQTITVQTNESGEATTSITASDCPAAVIITGTAVADCCGGCEFTGSDRFLVVCDPNTVNTLVIALDWTGSMNCGRKAASGLNQLLQDLKDAGVALRVGGVKFIDEVNNAYCLPLTSDYDAVAVWLDNINGADTGGDTNENALEALKKASQLGPGGYIALATDAGFHYWGDNDDPASWWHSNNQPPKSDDCIYTQMTSEQARALLLTANCKVYIDAGDTIDETGTHSWQHYTSPATVLHVNGEMEDWNVADSDRYKFPKLKAAILGQ